MSKVFLTPHLEGRREEEKKQTTVFIWTVLEIYCKAGFFCLSTNDLSSEFDEFQNIEINCDKCLGLHRLWCKF